MSVLLISGRRIKALEQQIQELKEQVEQMQKAQCTYCVYKEKEDEVQQTCTSATGVLQKNDYAYETRTNETRGEQTGLDTEMAIINEVLSEVFPV